MNIALGQSALLLGLLGAVAGAISLALGAFGKRPSLLRAGHGYIWLVVGGAVLAVVAMERALITHDFSLVYVDNNDSTFLPLVYRISAMWSDLAGSILLWALVLSGYLGVMWARTRARADEPLVLWAKVTGYCIAAFFFALMLTASNPFTRVHGAIPTQGPGPNPLLQDRLLVAFHPPLLYMGLVGFTVPFCFAIAGLVTGQANEVWLAEARRWAIFAWICLTAGVVLGAWWSSQIFAWDGYWVWDPVENVAFLPWLTATAFVHSALVQQRRAILRVWNLSLLLATFSLTILGTFLTRSAVLTSIHSFTNDGGVGPAFLGFFALVVAVSIGLLAWRGDKLRTSGPVALVSREGAFLLNNFLFAAFAFVVLLGTVFPLFAEAFNGQSLTIGPPYFDLASMPIVVCLLFLMAVAPVLPWRQSTAPVLGRRLLWPAAFAAAVVVACVVAGARGFWPLVVFGLAAFAGASALRQLALHVRAKGALGLVGRAGGGMIAHLGIVLMAVAFTASSAYAQTARLTLAPGRTAHFDGHSFVYLGSRTVNGPGRTSLVATVEVDGVMYHPAIEEFALNDNPVNSPSYHSTLAEDILLTLSSTPNGPHGRISLDVAVKPLVIWLWLGAAVVVGGGALALVPDGRRRRPRGPPPDDEAPAARLANGESAPAPRGAEVGAGV